MLKTITTIFIISAVCSCGSKPSSSDGVVNEEECRQCTHVETCSNSVGETATAGSNLSNTDGSASYDENATGADGYQLGYDMGFIAGESNMEYDPYLPKTAYYSLSYRQAYCRGYDYGYQCGQQASGRPSYHVNTGDEPADIEYYDDNDYDYDDY